MDRPTIKIGTTEEDEDGQPVGMVMLTISVDGSRPYRISPETLERQVAHVLKNRKRKQDHG